MSEAQRIFISYSSADEAFKDELVAHLASQDRAGRLLIWQDGQIELGDEWQCRIEEELNECHTALLLVSADFLASRFICDDELPILMRRREAGEIRVVPIILRACDLKPSGLDRIEYLPKTGTVAEAPHRDQIWSELATRVRQWCDETEILRAVAAYNDRVASFMSGPDIFGSEDDPAAQGPRRKFAESLSAEYLLGLIDLLESKERSPGEFGLPSRAEAQERARPRRELMTELKRRAKKRRS